MSRVFVDGVRYIPISKDKSVQKLARILDSNQYITRTVGNQILNEFKREIPAKTNSKNNSQDKHLFSKSNVKKIDDNGHVHFKRGAHPKSQWTIDQLLEIQTQHINGTLTDDSITYFKKMWGFKHGNVSRMVCDVKSGYCDELINEWKQMNKKTHEPQNNPQKRREERGF